MNDKLGNIAVRVVSVSTPVVPEIPDAEGVISYAARVSNPSNQDNFETAEKLLKYCADHGHWSVFEQATATVEIVCPRDISRQVLRHRSFSFQEFSQRYAEVDSNSFIKRECRMQDHSNRQNSILLSECHGLTKPERGDILEYWDAAMDEVSSVAMYHYNNAIEMGIAKEVARVLLPEGLVLTRLYMTGTLRSWMHYLDVRTGKGTQKEHVLLANKVKEALKEFFPNIIN